jgi:hypothetical protein
MSSVVEKDAMTPFLLPTLLADQLDAHEFAALTRDYLLRKQGYAKRGVDYGGLTSVLAPPVVAPARVRFKDVRTGEWIEGGSEPKIDCNATRIDLLLQAYDPCPRKAHWGKVCRCKKTLVGMREGPANLLTNVYANLVRVGILGTNTTVTDATGAGRALTKTMDGGVASLLGCAGTGVTAATVADTNMQTQTETQASVTVNTVSGAGATGTYTVVFTITATAPRSYTECGIKAITTTTAWNFLVAHDSFSALSVSTSGTLAVTYSITNA